MKRIRIATLFCPPAGLWLLWRNRDLSWGRRFLGTLGTLLYSLPDRHEEAARFHAIHGKTWNHPAIADGKILVRNAVEMACFEIGAP